jgi:hypothetical protein
MAGAEAMAGVAGTTDKAARRIPLSLGSSAAALKDEVDSGASRLTRGTEHGSGAPRFSAVRSTDLFEEEHCV